jgi:hypothetical protein
MMLDQNHPVVLTEGFDPRASAERQRATPLTRMGKSWPDPPERYFCGSWEQRNSLNVPGPFYGADTDTCWDGPIYAPDSLLCDAAGQGFVWRQPRNDTETHALLAGASSDPFRGFAWDGNDFWTPQSVRRWWQERGKRTVAISALTNLLSQMGLTSPEPDWRAIAREYNDYLGGPIELDLRDYLFFLEEGRYPLPEDVRPDL